MNQHKTQGERIAAELKRRARTSMEIQQLGISTCWHKRLAEYLMRKQPTEALVKTKNANGLTTYRIRKAA